MYLLDTNTVSDLMRHPGGHVAARLATIDAASVVISPVVACEIAFGLARLEVPRLKTAWSLILAALPIVPMGDELVQPYASVRRALEAAGTPIGPNDLLIAAHALALDAVVVTDNVREFSRVPGLQVENWLVPVDPPGEGPT